MNRVSRILPKFIKWVTLEQLEQMNIPECQFDGRHEDILMQEIVANRYIICGDTHQHLAIPVFDDGYALLSMRTWADLMDGAAMEIDGYTYVRGNYSKHSFYMASGSKIKERLPKCE